jgi:hypothetical protein
VVSVLSVLPRTKLQRVVRVSVVVVVLFHKSVGS